MPDTAAARTDTDQSEHIPPPGTPAPEFRLRSTPDQQLSLHDLRGRPVVLVFYPADWSPVCGDELALFNEVVSDIREYGAELVGISVDGVWCHAAFARERHLHFPLLADFEPKGAVSRAYGAYREQEGTSARALFVLDGEGVIRWSYLSPVGVNPGADGVLNALETMRGAGTANAARAASSTSHSDSRPEPRS